MIDIRINKESGVPIYLQVASQIEECIRKGDFKVGELLPSLNDLSRIAEIGRDSANKAYTVLLNRRVVGVRQGKGFFVTERSEAKMRVLLLIDKLSSHQQRMVYAFCDRLGEAADVTLLMHNQNLALLEEFVNDNLGLYDYYAVVPHFKTDKATVKKVVSLLSRIPERRLLLMDHIPEGFEGYFGAVYQNISEDIPHALSEEKAELDKYQRIRVVRMSKGIYQDETWRAVKAYCDSIGMTSLKEEGLPGEIKKGDVFLLTGSRLDFLLVELSRKILDTGLELGREVGIICQNDFVINEIVLGGLTTISSDYAKIGTDAADMILSGDLKQIHCECDMVRRRTF